MEAAVHMSHTHTRVRLSSRRHHSCLAIRLQLPPPGVSAASTQAPGMPGSDPVDRVMESIGDGGDGGQACHDHGGRTTTSGWLVWYYAKLYAGYKDLPSCGKVLIHVSQRAGAAAAALHRARPVLVALSPNSSTWHHPNTGQLRLVHGTLTPYSAAGKENFLHLGVF